MITVHASSAHQIRVELADELAHRVSYTGTVFVEVNDDGTVKLFGDMWNVWIRRTDNVSIKAAGSARTKLVDKAVAAAAEWLKTNAFALASAQVYQSLRAQERAASALLDARIAYEQAIGEDKRAQAAYRDDVRKLEAIG